MAAEASNIVVVVVVVGRDAEGALALPGDDGERGDAGRRCGDGDRVHSGPLEGEWKRSLGEEEEDAEE